MNNNITRSIMGAGRSAITYAQAGLDWASRKASGIISGGYDTYNRGRTISDLRAPRAGAGYYANQVMNAPGDIVMSGLNVIGQGLAGIPSAVAHPARTVTGIARTIDTALSSERSAVSLTAEGVRIVGTNSIRQNSALLGAGLGHGVMIVGPSRLAAGRVQYIGRAGGGVEAIVLRSNTEVRTWYSEQVKNLDTSGPLTEATAARVNEARNSLKQQARDMMMDRPAANQLANEQPLLPLPHYVEKYSSQGYQNEALWQRIIEGSRSPNPAVDQRFGVRR